MTEANTNDKARPTHTIYKVLGDGQDARWVKVGIAFPHKDRKGLALIFDGIPVEGRIALRVNRKPDEAAKAPARPAETRELELA
ncbi:MAG: hypothetical protein H6873_01195 [Hyphomicrobiaceae bacterium]|nr:hypothetical protein [Hyphomicrobiaceae bacterium]